jgi:acetylornithine/LysW-gamma-L-lysine aminotransferase
MSEIEDQHLIPTYQKFPIRIVRGDGALLYDSLGTEYIDLSGGYGVAIIGHANPFVARAISEQSRKLITCHGSLYNDAREEYLEELIKVLPKGLGSLYFCNSGTEANEAAIKFAKKKTGRKEVVAFTGSYHGKTYGSLSTTWNQKYRKPFEPLLGGVKFSPFGNSERAGELVTKETAAIIVEPIQGESGIHIPPDGFLANLREIAYATGAVLIFDEVQSGFGRTGKMWACENWRVEPDILTASKGIAGGVPFGFVAAREDISSIMRPGDHTSTFGGNALCCSAALAALRFLQKENLIERARANGDFFLEKLETRIHASYPSLIREVRGKGLMLAAEMKIPVKESIMLGFKHGLILLYSGVNILRFLPPLVITKEQIDKAVEGLYEILGSVESYSNQRSMKQSLEPEAQ